jgi:hypothetical protein
MSIDNVFTHDIKKHLYVPVLMVFFLCSSLLAQSLDIPASTWGISFGNSKKFTGLRFNFRDSHVDEIKGLNVTLWTPKENEQSRVTGISFGVIPGGGTMRGLNLGIAGVGADKRLCGISLGLLGVGSGGEMRGIMVGGLGAGGGGNVTGLAVGGLGVGTGGNLKGIMFGGLGAGSGGNMSGIGIGLIGVGSGSDLTGLMIGGIGAGAGGDAKGIILGGIGAGAGGDFTGFGFGLIGVGAGGHLKGIAVGGVGAGAPEVTGLVIGGIGAGALDFTGAALALGFVKIDNNGMLKGGSVSAFNYIKGTQRGITLGIVNYAYELHGIQIGLINYVRDNPILFKIMPLVNFNLSD